MKAFLEEYSGILIAAIIAAMLLAVLIFIVPGIKDAVLGMFSNITGATANISSITSDSDITADSNNYF